MTYRLANLSDINSLSKLLLILFTKEKEFIPNRQAQIDGLTQIISNNEIGFIALAEENDKIIGMVNVLYTISTALGTRVAILEDMITTVRGSGSGLLKFAMKLAYENGCKRVTLLTDFDNKDAIKFYEKNGFEKSTMVPFRLFLNENN